MGSLHASRAGRAKSGASFAAESMLRPRHFRRAAATGVRWQGNSVAQKGRSKLGNAFTIVGRASLIFCAVALLLGLADMLLFEEAYRSLIELFVVAALVVFFANAVLILLFRHKL